MCARVSVCMHIHACVCMHDTMWVPPGEHISRGQQMGVHVYVVRAERVRGDRCWVLSGCGQVWRQVSVLPEVLGGRALLPSIMEVQWVNSL